MADSLDIAAIDAALAGTPFAGRLHHFSTIDSTNTYGLAQARLGAPHGSCYVADEQTAGRGRSDHKWHSLAGDGLYLSVLLRLEPSAVELTWLPLMAGLAVHRAIGEVTALDVDLRWPNDLLIGPRKVGGILAEAAGDAVVVGIGINLHQRGFPPGLSTEPTSLDLESGRDTSRQELLITLLHALGEEVVLLSNPSAVTAIPARIAVASSWVHGRHVEVHGPQACVGVTEGLDARGFLRVRTAAGLVTVTTGGIRAALD